jgi:hypothetical protein
MTRRNWGTLVENKETGEMERKMVTDPVDVFKTIRIKRAMELRGSGLNYETIAQIMRNEFGNQIGAKYDGSRACKDVKDALLYARTNMAETATEIIELELERLDKMFMVAYNLALSGSFPAIETALKIMNKRAMYLGLYKPKAVQVSDWRTEILNLIRSGKITLSQVKEQLGDEMTSSLLSGDNLMITDGIAKEEDIIIDGQFSETKQSES